MSVHVATLEKKKMIVACRKISKAIRNDPNIQLSLLWFQKGLRLFVFTYVKVLENSPVNPITLSMPSSAGDAKGLVSGRLAEG